MFTIINDDELKKKSMSYENLYFLKNPIKVGAILAMIISWSRNKSVLMALVYGFFGWLFIII